MKSMAVEPHVDRIIVALGRSPLFRRLTEAQLRQVAAWGKLVSIEVDEILMRKGEASDSFFLVLKGYAVVMIPSGADRATRGGDEANALVEVARLGPLDLVGEMGLILGQERSATVIAAETILAVRYEANELANMFDRVTGFGLGVAQALAERLARSSQSISLPDTEWSAASLDTETVGLLPSPFIARHRVLPLKVEGNVLTLGVVDDPNPSVVSLIRQLVPGLELRPTRIEPALVDEALKTLGGTRGRTASSATGSHVFPQDPAKKGVGTSRDLRSLLSRVAGEGASDLHLSAGLKVRWRLDGKMRELHDSHPLGEEEAMSMLEDAIPPRARRLFEETNDADFSYALKGLARFRVNLFRNHRGVSAVLRRIPEKVLTLDQLALPPAVRDLCNTGRGLVLVTGPTGSGKSTTLAAMINEINKTRDEHILTLEDPIEFVHESQASLVNQREIGEHTQSFSNALRAALREDPDVVLVGEMRDLETVALALEVANTGHLVFGTLHTNTAVGTVDRIVNQFPAGQQAQIRITLAEVLVGVVCQTLCHRLGGGRVAAMEILVANHGIRNLIREGKTHQIPSMMSTGRGIGNMLQNQHLEQLVRERKMDREEALRVSQDADELNRRLGGT